MILKILILFLTLIPTVVSSQENPEKLYLYNNVSNIDVNKKQKLLYDFKYQNIPSDTNNDQPEFIMTKSPLTAVLLSAALPGAGQFYNESYWKIPVIAGVGGYLVYEIIQSNNNYSNYADQYAASVTPANPQGDARLLSLREFYRDERDRFYIYGALLYLVQLADAYVDAELYDFDVSDKMKFSLMNKGLFSIKINL